LEAIHKQHERASEAGEMVETFVQLNQQTIDSPRQTMLFTQHESIEVCAQSARVQMGSLPTCADLDALQRAMLMKRLGAVVQDLDSPATAIVRVSHSLRVTHTHTAVLPLFLCLVACCIDSVTYGCR
jgi:hypothetical protein